MSTTTNLGLTVGTDQSAMDIPDWVTQTEANMALIDTFAGTVRKKPTRETFTIQSNAWASASGVSPFAYSATVTASTTIGVDTLVELINDNALAFAAHGFAIGDVTGQVITIYTVNAPADAVTLIIDIGGD